MSRAGSAVAASQRGDEPWLAADAASKPLSKADALARPDAVLQEAIALVTATHTASLRKRRGDAGGGERRSARGFRSRRSPTQRPRGKREKPNKG